jgi:hypothetical protein
MRDANCQGLEWPNPDYTFTEIECGFRCECQLETANVVVAGEGAASKKQG